MEFDEREGALMDYLDTLLPADWYERTPEERVDFFQGRDALTPTEECTLRRDVVCGMEIWRECFGKPQREFEKIDSYDIANLMAKIAGWERSSTVERLPKYGTQRPFKRVVKS